MFELLPVALVFLIIAGSGAISSRIKQSPLPFYLLMGIVFGPHGLRVAEDSEVIRFMAELGMVFLLLFLGMEFSLKRLQSGSNAILKAGGVDLAVNFSLGLAVAIFAGFSPEESLLFAGIVYMSSSGIATKALIDLKRLANPETESILGVMIFEDLFIVLFFILFSGIVLADAFSPVAMLQMILPVVLFLGAFILVARRYSHLIVGIIEIKSEELFVLGLFSSVLLLGALAQEAGLSAAIGGFFLGLLLSEVGESIRLRRRATIFKDLFAGVFFFYSGMLINLSGLGELKLLPLLGIPLFIAAKVLTGYFVGRFQGITSKKSLFVGFGIAPRGEFSLILANFGLLLDLSGELYSYTAILVLVSSIAGVLLMAKSDAIYEFMRKLKILGSRPR